MTQDRKIRLKLSIQAVKDFAKVVSDGKQLCHDVFHEVDQKEVGQKVDQKDVSAGIKLQRLSDSLRGVYAIFNDRKKNKTETSAKQMLQKLDDKIQQLLKVKDHYKDVLTNIKCKLASLQVLVEYVDVIERRNRNLNLPIEVVQDFRNVLSLGIIHAEELSKERNKRTDKAPDLKHQLKVYFNSLQTQEKQLTNPAN